jgi:hypothetical protein
MRRAYLVVIVGLVAVFGTSGCRKMLQKRQAAREDAGWDTAPVRESNAPMTPTWKDTEVTFTGASGIGSFSYNGTKLMASFRDVSPGDSIEMGTDRATATTSRYMSAETDVGAKIAKLRPVDAFDYKYRFNPETQVHLVLGGRPVTIDAPAAPVSYGLNAAFKKVIDAPINLPAPEKPPTEHTILFTEGLSGSDVIGPAATVDAIDWVALGSKLPERKGKMCSGYKRTGEAGAGETLPLVMKDEHLGVYDVRTSKEIAAKDFKAPEECPTLTFSKEANSYPSKDEMKAWLRSVRTQKNPPK